jgi:hypothetical protein
MTLRCEKFKHEWSRQNSAAIPLPALQLPGKIPLPAGSAKAGVSH